MAAVEGKGQNRYDSEPQSALTVSLSLSLSLSPKKNPLSVQQRIIRLAHLLCSPPLYPGSLCN